MMMDKALHLKDEIDKMCQEKMEQKKSLASIQSFKKYIKKAKIN